MNLPHLDLLTAPVPCLATAEAEVIARDIYGLDGRASGLSGERDRNFKLRNADGRTFIVKLSNPSETEDVIDFQIQALLHLEAVAPDLYVPRVVRALNGETTYRVPDRDGNSLIVRVLTYISGTPLHEVESTATLRDSIADFLARLDLALRDFDHPASRHALLWNLTRAASLRELLVHVPRDRRPLIERQLDRFEQRVAPQIPQLRSQVIHNDLNPQNAVVDKNRHDHIAGVFDFGDMVHAPLINELAIAAAYQLKRNNFPLGVIGSMAARYSARYPLKRLELELLVDLIATRLMLTVCIGAWRATLHPGNSSYILRSHADAWEGLAWMDELDPKAARAILHKACEGYLDNDE